MFLQNGTLLQTSCVETYRVAKWKADPKKAALLHITEDGRPAFTADIEELTRTKLRFQQILIPSKEKRELTLEAISQESVCPDLPK